MTIKIFSIRNKETKEFRSFNGRVAWASPAAAKSSFLAATSYYRSDGKKFNDQDEYAIVELTEIVAMYEGLCK